MLKNDFVRFASESRLPAANQRRGRRIQLVIHTRPALISRFMRQVSVPLRHQTARDR